MAKKGKGGKSGSAKKGGKGDEAAAMVVAKAMELRHLRTAYPANCARFIVQPLPSVAKHIDKCAASVASVALPPSAAFNPSAPFGGALVPLAPAGGAAAEGAATGAGTQEMPNQGAAGQQNATPAATPTSFAMAAASSSGQPLPTLSSLDGFDRLLLSQTPISQNDVYALASTFATTADLKMVCLWKCTLDDRAVRVLCGTAFLRGHPGVTCLHIVGCGVRASGALHVARLLADLPDDVGDVEKLWDSSNTTDHGGDTVGHGHPPSHDTTKQRPTHPTTTTLPPLPFANSVSQPRKHASALTRTAPDLVPQPPPTKPPFTSLLTILVLDHNSGLGTVGVSLLFDAIRLTSMPKPAPSPSPAPSPDDAPSAPAPSADPAAPVDPPTSASPRSAKALAGGKPASFGCRLTKVSIRYCDAGEDAAGAIGRALEINTTIVDLDLTGNSLSNAGVLHIAPYLSRNTALQKLNLSSNLITDAIPTAEALLKLPRFPAPFDYAEALRYHAARREEGGGSTGGGGAGAGQDASGDSAGATTEPTDPSPPVLLSPLESLACAITAPVNPSSALSYLDLRSNDVGDHGGQVVMNLLKARKGKVQVKVGERMGGVVFGQVGELSDLAAGGGKKGGKGKGKGKKK